MFAAALAAMSRMRSLLAGIVEHVRLFVRIGVQVVQLAPVPNAEVDLPSVAPDQTPVRDVLHTIDLKA